MTRKCRYPWLFLLVLALLLSIGATALAQESETKPDLLYFYENRCDACNPAEDFKEKFYELTGRFIEEYNYQHYNIISSDNRALFEKIAAEYGYDKANHFLPFVVIDGKAYMGNTKVETALPRAFIENTSTDSLVYYLYSPACESCAKVKALIETLPQTLTVTRGKVEFESALTVQAINIFEDFSTAQALFEHYQVPEEKQTTPIIFLRDEYVQGADSIERRLPLMLSKGNAVGTQLIAPAGAEGSQALSIASTAVAGLVAGFNPCALSMLLLFLSILISSGQKLGRYAAVYLITKFVTYLAIGTVFLSLLSAWNPTWLPLASKLLLTLVGGVLAVMNLMDAWAAHREKYGQIRNQLPRRLRQFLNDRIKATLENKKGALIFSVALLGVIVAASEFLCSGQLYLASITAGISSGAVYARQILLLLIFCAAFLLPAIVLTILVVRSQSMFGAADAILKRMPLIKLATAIVMVLIILAAWFLL